MSDTVNSKEAMFMLDMDIDQEMASYGQEVTEVAVKFINSSPEAYKMSISATDEKELKTLALRWAEDHNNEFGELFQTELDQVDWSEVKRKI